MPSGAGEHRTGPLVGVLALQGAFAAHCERLTELGVRVAVDQEDPEDVAAEFLASLAG